MSILKGFLILFAFQFMLVSSPVNAQSKRFQVVYTNTEQLMIDEVILTNTFTLSQLISHFGKADSIADYPKGEKILFYNHVGIMFSLKDTMLKGMGINFNWDGDKKFPKQSFTGTLKIKDIAINKETNIRQFESDDMPDFDCPIPIMCGTEIENSIWQCMVGFENDKITQLLFIVK